MFSQLGNEIKSLVEITFFNVVEKITRRSSNNRFCFYTVFLLSRKYRARYIKHLSRLRNRSFSKNGVVKRHGIRDEYYIMRLNGIYEYAILS